MKKILIATLALAVSFSVCFCSKTKKITPELFINMQNEFLSSDQTDKAKEAIAQKSGFSAKDYDDFEKLIETDAALKAKVGELRLQSEKKK